MKNCNCVNFGNCSRADTAQVVEVDPSVLEPLCEECGRPMNETAGRGGSGGGGRARNGVMAIVMLVVAIGMFYGAFQIIRRPVTITSPLAVNTAVGAAFSYDIVATGNPKKFTATGLPAGLKLNPADGKIVGKAEKEGKAVVEIAAISPKGADKKKLEITIAVQVVKHDEHPIPPKEEEHRPKRDQTESDPKHPDRPELATTTPPLVEDGHFKVDLDEGLRCQLHATGNPDRYWAGQNAPAGTTVDTASGSLTAKFSKAGIYEFSVYAARGTSAGQGHISVEVIDRKGAVRSALVAASGHVSDLAALENEAESLRKRPSANGESLSRILNDRIASLRQRIGTDLTPLHESLDSGKAPVIDQVVAALVRDTAEFKGKEAHRNGMNFLARNWRKLSETSTTSGVLLDMRADMMRTVLQRG